MFTVNPQGAIVYGLGAIKGLGEGPIENIIAARDSGGPFTDLFDFCERTDPRKVNKRAIEALIRSGSFDSLGVDRAILLASMPEAVKAAEQSASNRDAGMSDLFGDVVTADENGDVYADFRDTRPQTPKVIKAILEEILDSEAVKKKALTRDTESSEASEACQLQIKSAPSMGSANVKLELSPGSG